MESHATLSYPDFLFILALFLVNLKFQSFLPSFDSLPFLAWWNVFKFQFSSVTLISWMFVIIMCNNLPIKCSFNTFKQKIIRHLFGHRALPIKTAHFHLSHISFLWGLPWDSLSYQRLLLWLLQPQSKVCLIRDFFSFQITNTFHFRFCSQVCHFCYKSWKWLSICHCFFPWWVYWHFGLGQVLCQWRRPNG